MANYVYILMCGKGPYSKTTDGTPCRFYDNEAAALEHLHELRKTTNHAHDIYAHVTTHGRNYFTFKYDWPIQGAELRHTYWVEAHRVFPSCQA